MKHQRNCLAVDSSETMLQHVNGRFNALSNRHKLMNGEHEDGEEEGEAGDEGDSENEEENVEPIVEGQESDESSVEQA